jgi:Methane oxygenase PmoA
MRITHEIGQWIGLTDDNGVERLRYDYASAPKPFIHPLRLPDGTIITEHEPADHLWHRGLWFAFKFVNGINYWEERDEIFGYQRNKHMGAGDSPTGEVTLSQTLLWSDTSEGKIIELPQCWEQRSILADLDDAGNLCLSWLMKLTAMDKDVTLDRTPFTTWGGYGGLFVRLKNDLENPRLVFDDGTVTTRCTGERYKWGGIEGTTPDGKDCAVVFLPSPQNTRSPEPFYGAAKTDYNFFGPAPLFHEPIVLKAGETFTYQVKVLVLPCRINPDEINAFL